MDFQNDFLTNPLRVTLYNPVENEYTKTFIFWDPFLQTCYRPAAKTCSEPLRTKKFYKIFTARIGRKSFPNTWWVEIAMI